MKITPANIAFNEQGTPLSNDFEDVYFSNNDGLAETEYVFLQGNRLFERWQSHPQSHFCIGETGFGTGLNFFCTAKLFKKFRQQFPDATLQHLYFISTEKHPIERSQIEQVLTKWSMFDAFTTQWLQRYPVSVDGIHRVHFDDNIILDLHYNDACDAFNSLYCPPSGLVDAWFLDGFAPSKNSAMWSQEVFTAMARLSKAKATLATFTAAGFVKRGLVEAGFSMRKQKGFGRKREMLVGELSSGLKEDTSHQYTSMSPPYFQRCTPSAILHNKPKAQTTTNERNDTVCVTGNGLAGAIMALKLVQQGVYVDLVWSGNAPADAASGALVGGFYPQLNAQNNYASRLQLSSFLYAKNFYNELHQISPFNHQWCGALQLGFNKNTQERLSKLSKDAIWPSEIAHSVSPETASNIANIAIPYASLYMPLAGWISPVSLVNACIQAAMQTGKLRLRPNTSLVSFDDTAQTNQHDASQHNTSTQTSAALQVRLEHQGKETIESFSALVIATGSGSQSLLSPLVPLRVTRGQIELIESSGTLANLQTLICHKGYLTPALKGFHALGSSYVKNDKQCDVRQEETEQNFDMHTKSMHAATWLGEFEQYKAQANNYSRAAIRCSSPDHLPVVGTVPSEAQLLELASLYKALPAHHYKVPSVRKNVYVLTGLGSRGLTTAPLMAELLVSEMLNRPLPLPLDLLNALMPNRFIVRSLIRRQALES